jgi:hypothetical protein
VERLKLKAERLKLKAERLKRKAERGKRKERSSFSNKDQLLLTSGNAKAT